MSAARVGGDIFINPITASATSVSLGGGILLLAYALYFPNRVIIIIFLPFIQIPARTFVIGYGVIELLL